MDGSWSVTESVSPSFIGNGAYCSGPVGADDSPGMSCCRTGVGRSLSQKGSTVGNPHCAGDQLFVVSLLSPGHELFVVISPYSELVTIFQWSFVCDFQALVCVLPSLSIQYLSLEVVSGCPFVRIGCLCVWTGNGWPGRMIWFLSHYWIVSNLQLPSAYPAVASIPFWFIWWPIHSISDLKISDLFSLRL